MNSNPVLRAYCAIIEAIYVKMYLPIIFTALSYQFLGSFKMILLSYLFDLCRRLGWFKNPLSSQTEKLMAATKFSEFLGLNHYKKAKKLKHFNHLGLAQGRGEYNV